MNMLSLVNWRIFGDGPKASSDDLVDSLHAEFFKGREVTIFFEKIDYSASNYAVDIAKDHFGSLVAIGAEMEVIGHDHVCEDQEAPEASCLVEGLACDGFDLVRAENWLPSFATDVR